MLYLVPTYERSAYHPIYSRPVVDLSCRCHGYDHYGYGYDQYEYENYLRQKQLLALKKQREYQQRLAAQRQRLARRDARRVLSILALAEDIYNQLNCDDTEEPVNQETIEQGQQNSHPDQEEVQNVEQAEEQPEKVPEQSAEPAEAAEPAEIDQDQRKEQEDVQPPKAKRIRIPIDDGEPDHLENATAKSDCGKSDSGQSTKSDKSAKSDSAKSDASYSMIELLRQKADPIILG